MIFQTESRDSLEAVLTSFYFHSLALGWHTHARKGRLLEDLLDGHSDTGLRRIRRPSISFGDVLGRGTISSHHEGIACAGSGNQAEGSWYEMTDARKGRDNSQVAIMSLDN